MKSWRIAIESLEMMLRWALPAIVALVASPAAVQPPSSQLPFNALRDLNAAIEALTKKVAPSVVQILVTGYRPMVDAGRGDAGLVVGRQRTVGSGAIIGADGYIITNAHVVAGAQQVRVVLPAPAADAGPLQSLASASGTTVPATIVGVAQDIDLALIKVEALDLPAIPLANYDEIRQGELVFAFGSPEGLRDSVTMGVVSSVARQTDPDSPSVYVQTDAPINRGNSGGPLVNVKGELVGMNTFILSESGGSQGLGFAIPSVVIAAAIPQLRRFGHLHRGMVGINVQAITPLLADGLSLPRSSGVIVADLMASSPADIAGVEVGDIIITVNTRPVVSVPMLTLSLNTLKAGDTVTFGLMRGDRVLSVAVPVVERPRQIDELSELADTDKNAIPKLGVIGVDLDDAAARLLSDLRIPSGVLVTARRLESDTDSPLVAGDVIHALNTFAVRSLDGLRVLLDSLKANSPIVLQIERDHRLMFVTMVVD
jgi:serine protease Do